MTTSTRRARRRPGGGAGSDTLARLVAAREQLDADIVAQRRREDELLAEYAAVADAAGAVAARRDAALADLDRQAAQVRAAADRELSALEAQQGAVLVAMHAHRPADGLANLVDLPVKQVRGLLRTHRAPAQASPAGDGGTRLGVAPVPRTGLLHRWPRTTPSMSPVDRTGPHGMLTGCGEAVPDTLHHAQSGIGGGACRRSDRRGDRGVGT